MCACAFYFDGGEGGTFNEGNLDHVRGGGLFGRRRQYVWHNLELDVRRRSGDESAL